MSLTSFLQLPIGPGTGPSGQALASPLTAHGKLPPLHVGATAVVSQLTGAASPNDTTRWGVHGTDLGHMFKHRGTLYMAFGDTFGEGGFGGANWRSNVLARLADDDPRNGFVIETMISGADGLAKELIPSRKVNGVEKTVIPTNGISIGGRMHLHYMSVRSWGSHSEWQVGFSGIAYSDDDGRTWVTPQEAVWPGGSGFEQVAFVEHDGMVYSFGIPEGRFGGVRLRRVAPEQILQPDAYRYWDGARWVEGADAAATIVPAPVGELSVSWSEGHRRWLMMYLDPERGAVVLRSAAQLTGSWSEPQVIITARDYPGLYAPYIVPGSEIGRELYFTMSRWRPYNVFLMRTTLEPVVAGDAPAPSAVVPVSEPN